MMTRLHRLYEPQSQLLRHAAMGSFWSTLKHEPSTVATSWGKNSPISRSGNFRLGSDVTHQMNLGNVHKRLEGIANPRAREQLLSKLRCTPRTNAIIRQLNQGGAQIRPIYWRITDYEQPDNYRHFLGFKAKGSMETFSSTEEVISFAITRLLFQKGKRKLVLDFG